MDIDLEVTNSVCVSKDFRIEGILNDGRRFFSNVNWNNTSGWNLTANDVEMDKSSATDEELAAIVDIVRSRYGLGALENF